MKLYLFLRSIVWTSILSVSAAVAALITAFTTTDLTITIAFGFTAITLAVLAPKVTL